MVLAMGVLLCHVASCRGSPAAQPGHGQPLRQWDLLLPTTPPSSPLPHSFPAVMGVMETWPTTDTRGADSTEPGERKAVMAERKWACQRAFRLWLSSARPKVTLTVLVL